MEQSLNCQTLSLWSLQFRGLIGAVGSWTAVRGREVLVLGSKHALSTHVWK